MSIINCDLYLFRNFHNNFVKGLHILFVQTQISTLLKI
jgi:hypothetical protein